MMSAGEERSFSGRGFSSPARFTEGAGSVGSAISDCEYEREAYMPHPPRESRSLGALATTDLAQR